LILLLIKLGQVLRIRGHEAYSPNVVEYEFYEVELPLYGVLRSSEHRGGPGLLLIEPRPFI
jgi:hypothetical protein